jgi:hypothetical protein
MFDVLYIYWYTLAAELVIQYILDILLYFLIMVDTLIVHAYAFFWLKLCIICACLDLLEVHHSFIR